MPAAPTDTDMFDAEEFMVKCANDPAMFNNFLHEELLNNHNGKDEQTYNKVASAAGLNIRTHQREDGIFRNVLTPEKVTDAMLTPSERHDNPRILREMEASQVMPRIVSLGAPTQTTPFRGDKYEIMFFEIQTPEFQAQLDRLRTYTTDLRQVVTENFLRDIQRVEDEYAFAEADVVCGTPSGVGLTGLNQYTVINGEINHQTWPTTKSAFIERVVPHGVNVVGQTTWLEFEKWDSNQLGFELRERMFLQGTKTLQENAVGNVKHLISSKNWIFPRGLVYQFAEPGYLGNFCVLEDIVVYVKRERSWVKTSATEKIGITFANTAGLQKYEFAY